MAPGKPGLIYLAAIRALLAAAFKPALPVLEGVPAFVVVLAGLHSPLTTLVMILVSVGLDALSRMLPVSGMI